MNIRTENWNGSTIRFVDKHPGEWWGVAVDICRALELHQVTRALKSLPSDGVTTVKAIDSMGREQQVNAVSPKNIYRLVFKSRKKEATAFQDWVFDVLESLRHASGLEGFQVFRMLDKEHQMEAMERLRESLRQPVKVDYIKANTIANKTVSTLYGHPKMVKKGAMSPEMLAKRQAVLDDTVDLMATVERFGLDLSVSETVYGKYAQ
ncbi:BRO-N domain-containing protein [Alicyclobacillus sp. ALC3]|uniref:BRO-N domain-containing protein n=1 Tax=Alicyclobacillus sp. ALC3 TaxID=2796143 RepID=UPI0023785A78|nr:BRO family protein [Alicyclobacillus sp. ALC3]WDL97841.1 phage repressor protein [Alicyclobacillus sp. ALC3]